MTKKILVTGDQNADWYKKGVEVHVEFEGRLVEDGTVFESCVFPKTLVVKCGSGQAIKGWELGIPTMKIGEIARFFVGFDHAYGGPGKPPSIPQLADLIFDIELLQADGTPAIRWCLTDSELITKAEGLKDEGNASFKTKQYIDAITKYRDSMAHINQLGRNKKPNQPG